MPGPRISDDHIEAHEDRIQRLETGHGQVASQLAAQTVQLDYVAKTLESGLKDVGSKLDDVAGALRENIDAVAHVVSENTRKIKTLQDLEAKRLQGEQERVATIKKWVIGVALAIGGALGGSIGNWIWQKLTSTK